MFFFTFCKIWIIKFQRALKSFEHFLILLEKYAFFGALSKCIPIGWINIYILSGGTYYRFFVSFIFLIKSTRHIPRLIKMLATPLCGRLNWKTIITNDRVDNFPTIWIYRYTLYFRGFPTLHRLKLCWTLHMHAVGGMCVCVPGRAYICWHFVCTYACMKNARRI